MKWKPTLYTPLAAQENHVQASMFSSPEPRTEEPQECDHVGTSREQQSRLHGGFDTICGTCGRIAD